MMVMDPKTGEILVMVGCRDYFNEDIEGKNNNATACNSPGSAFKPFAYLTTFLNLGWGPGTLILDTPVTFPDGTNEPFTPTNPNRNFVGPISIRNALGNSLNIPASRLPRRSAPDKIVQLARKLGFVDTFDAVRLPRSGYGPAIATGGIDTTLEDMMVGYSVLANRRYHARRQDQRYRPHARRAPDRPDLDPQGHGQQGRGALRRRKAAARRSASSAAEYPT